MIEIRKPGLATTVQDLGRPGHYHLGIPQSGAMDRIALRAANLLVGNDEGAAGLEATFMGPEIAFERDALVAVTGATLPIFIDDVEQPGWTALDVRAGQVLRFGYLTAGARVYIGISGGIDVPLVLGSRSTYLVGAMGGHEGRALAAGDRLALGVARSAPVVREVPAALRRELAAPVALRVLPGIYDHRVTRDATEHFYADEWKVAPEADRMGYRFRGGRPVDLVPRRQPFGAGTDPSNITDASYAYGCIQVPGGLEPIVLHRDAVSAGGYFTIGVVISADMDLIAQMQPNMPTRFARVTMDEALAARAERRALMNAIRAHLAG